MAQMQRLGTHATTVCHTMGSLIVTYHSTAVVVVDAAGTVHLDTGGWQTNTTKTRMNQASAQFDLGYRVFAQKGEWYASTRDGRTLPFADGKCVIESERKGGAA